MDRLVQIKKDIVDVIGRVEDVELRILLEQRYLCGATWEEMSDTDATSVYCNSYLSPRNIVWVDFGFNIGNEFGGKHPAIILKNLNNDVLIVAPVSTNVNNSHVASNTVITFSGSDMYNMPSLRARFTNITRITPVSVYRLDTTSKVGSLKKEKYQELLQKVKNYY